MNTSGEEVGPSNSNADVEVDVMDASEEIEDQKMDIKQEETEKV